MTLDEVVDVVPSILKHDQMMVVVERL